MDVFAGRSTTLSPDRARTLLRRADAARLAVPAPDAGEAEVFAVRYTVTGAGDVVVRGGAGELDAVRPAARVVLEVEGADDGAAWSVTVRGRARVRHGAEAVEIEADWVSGRWFDRRS